MEKNKRWVISLGGSRIAPDKGINYNFIYEFEKLIRKYSSYKFVAVTGGGATARKYMKAIKRFRKGTKEQSMEGIAVTRMHAGFLARIFGPSANEPDKIPKSIKEVKNLLRKNHVVFCGALRWESRKTSDGTAADIAGMLKCPFINITNIRGLYTKNPKTNKKAKFIKKISWEKFNEMAKKIKFRTGQHFVLDQDAAETILKKKIPTYITGSLNDADKIISGKSYRGSLIQG